MYADLFECNLPGHGQWIEQHHRLSLHLYGARLAVNGRLHTRVRRNVLQNMARALNLHRPKAKQKGHQGLSAVYGGWRFARH